MKMYLNQIYIFILLNITILTTDKRHKIISYLKKWQTSNSKIHNISLVHNSSEAKNGDLLLLISCLEIISLNIRSKFKHTLVIHESDLPHGKGWSPLQWQLLDGVNSIVVTLFDAVDNVDSGDIWTKRVVEFEGHELADEINSKIFPVKLDLIDFAIKSLDTIKKIPQEGVDESVYPRRTHMDSEIDTNKSISEQFDLLRIADNERYPCFFDYNGYRYKISISKIDTE